MIQSVVAQALAKRPELVIGRTDVAGLVPIVI